MSRRAYHQLYYWRTVERRRQLARERKQRRYWARWLISALREA